LIGGKLIADDSTKLRAQNSKKNNFNENKIEWHLAYIDANLEEYNKALVEADKDNKQIIEEQIKKHKGRKDNYENMQRQLEQIYYIFVVTSLDETSVVFFFLDLI